MSMAFAEVRSGPGAAGRVRRGGRAAGGAASLIVAAALCAGCLEAPPATGPNVDLSTTAYVTSRACVSCHPDHDASWRRTFHRTMTQLPTPESVRGDFGDRAYEHDGVLSRFRRDGARYIIETLDPDTREMAAFEVALTVGSRRIQQYVVKKGDRHLRLPLAWNIEERRWFHLSAGFLHADGADFHQHTALWDGNCIFCHNTKPRPGYDPARQTYAAEVAELGIACEACHGPGAEHVAKNASPIRRYQLHYSDARDPTIVSPLELDAARSTEICGHCHGQRTPRPIERVLEILENGDPYTAGEPLGRYVAPIERGSKLAGVDLTLRFWKDGTPRLSAYEYQGLLASPCHTKGALACTSCHTAHGGDPRGMIEPEKRTSAACAPCHADLVRDPAPHTRHAAGSPGSDCYACHMPKLVYGLVAVHRTHRIQSPDPTRAWRHEMPDACALCHLDRTARWAAEREAELFGPKALQGGRGEPRGGEPMSGEPAWRVAESVRLLLAGDVVARAVAANALGEPTAYGATPRARLWAVPFLLVTMRDRYPAIRHIAYRSLRRLVAEAAAREPALERETAGLPSFDPGGPERARQRAIDAWRAWWGRLDKRGTPHPGEAVPLDDALLPDAAVVDALVAAQSSEVVAIGE